jgi:pilus assembly protein CpaB
MKGARLVVLGVAIAAGGGAAFLAAGSKEAPTPAPAVTLETIEILVAKTDLSRGQVIEGQDIGWQMWPTDAANPGFIRKSAEPDALAKYNGAIVRVAMLAGDPIRSPYVVVAKGSGFLAAVLAKGMRAAAVDISPESDAGGFVLPDDRVDVMLTRRDKAAEKATGVEKYTTTTVLRNIRVLAVDQTVDQKNGVKTAIGKTATLELTQSQAETLALSRQVGTISLALRSLLDSQATNDEDDSNEHASINTVRFGVSTLGVDH